MADLEERQRLLGDEDRGSGPGRPMLAICDPSRLLHRLVVLFFMCFLGFGKEEKAARRAIWEIWD